MIINILSTGRFHVLDLARELRSRGHTIKFYSCLPRSRTGKFGLPASNSLCLGQYVAPLLALHRMRLGKCMADLIHRSLLSSLDRVAASLMAPCDVLIGMSGLTLLSAAKFKGRYGSKILIERGSRHIISQREILKEISSDFKNRDLVPDWYVRRELLGYELADKIVIPSLHVERSFMERGFPGDRLFRNPYGVDLSMFSPTPAPPNRPSTILFVGTWSLQKGCDLLLESCRRLDGVKLLHVGAQGDLPFPRENWFEHHSPVPQWRLIDFYRRAHVFALASRQEGFGLVLAQALACGLPVVCTDRTGGEDLKEFLNDPSWVTVAPHDDSDALAAALEQATQRARTQHGMRDILRGSREKLSWSAYGIRYDIELRRRLAS